MYKASEGDKVYKWLIYKSDFKHLFTNTHYLQTKI